MSEYGQNGKQEASSLQDTHAHVKCHVQSRHGQCRPTRTHAHVPTAPGVKKNPPCLFPVSVGLSFMVCGECGRRSVFSPCTGCRTLGRIRFLWTSQIKTPDEGEALGCLRFCAGGLSDLVELRFGAEAQVENPPATGEAVAPGEPRADAVAPGEPRADTVEGVTPGASAPRDEESSEEDEVDKGGAESYSYETVEEEKPEEKRAVPEAEKEEAERASVPRFGRGSLSKPLGLTPACKKSTRKEETKPIVFRKEKPVGDHHQGRDDRKKRERSPQREGPAAGSAPAETEDRRAPRSPSRPPGGHRHHSHRRRSKSKEKKKRKSKGKKWRERGQEFRRNNFGARSTDRWRPR